MHWQISDASDRAYKLSLAPTMPMGTEDKCAYFYRIDPSKSVDLKFIDTEVMFGETIGAPLEAFRDTVSQVYIPSISAQEEWGKCTSQQAKEFSNTIEKLGNFLEFAVSSFQNEIELAVPDSKYRQIEDKPSAWARAAADNEIVLHFESVVESWCLLIEKLLTDLEKGRNDSDDAGPDTEYELWKKRMGTFNNLSEQLKKKESKLVLSVLMIAKSKIMKKWKSVDNAITDALNEAKDNVKYLSALEKYTEVLYIGNPQTAIDFLPALMNNLKMMFTIARYYSSQDRMTTLFLKISNQIIKMCRKHILCPAGVPVKIWEQDPSDLLPRLESCLKLNEAYRELYLSAKEKLRSMPKSRQFDFNEQKIFGRLDSLCKRIQKLIDMFTTIAQFSELASHTIEGMDALIKVFFDLVDGLRKKGYDILDFTMNNFDRDFLEFNVNVGELETDIQTFVNKCFENIRSTEQALSLLKKFESVLKRESLKGDLGSKHLLIFHNYGQDLEASKQTYEKNKAAAPWMRNSPPVAGNIMWARQLLRRIEEPMKGFQEHSGILDSKESKKIVKAYNKYGRALVEFETLWCQAWQKSIEALKAGLQASLVVRNPRSGRLVVNFDREILQLIRETKCLQRIGIEVPESAKMILLQEEKFKTYYFKLSFALKEQERILGLVMPVMRPLLKAHIESLDSLIQPGISLLTWQSMNIDGYLHKFNSSLSKFEDLVRKVNELIENRIERTLKMISKNVLVDIGLDKTFTLEEFVILQERMTKSKTTMMDSKNLEVERATDDLIDIVRGTVLEDMTPDPDALLSAKALRQHYNRMMYLSLLNATKSSFYILKKRLSSRGSSLLRTLHVERPLWEVSVELASPNVTINPSLEEIQAAINRCAINVLRCSKRIYRWGQNRKDDLSRLDSFHQLIAQDKEIVKMVLLLTGSVEGTKNKVHEHLDQFIRYAFLWKTDKQQAYSMFLKSNPSLESFDCELRKYMDLAHEVQDLPDKITVGCISLDATPFKDSVRSEAMAWMSQYTKNLHVQAKEDLQIFFDYMKDTCLKLDRTVSDLDDCREVMNVLKNIRGKESEIDFLISPIEDKYRLLRKYGMHVEKQELDTIADLRNAWKKVRSAAMSAGEKLNRLQGAFKKGLLEDVKDFLVDAKDFRSDFLEHGPMVHGLLPMEAAERLNKYKRLFAEKKRRWESYAEGEALFGLPLTRYPELEESQKEIDLLDKLYGVYVTVVQTIRGYGGMLWNDVVSNIDSMSEAATAFQNQCKRMPKQLREWDAYLELKTTIDDFSNILPILQQLSQKSMRLRHWEAIMQECKKRIPMDENGPSPELCKLQHILDLGMLKIADEIEDITSGSSKELQIEMKLKTIEDVWTGMAFQFQNFKSRGPIILKPKELSEIMEALEDSQMQLGSMASNRFSAPFRTRLQNWIMSLSTVSDIVEQWIAVQNLWIYMEAVFSSGDIAKQLPQEAKRFLSIDKSFMKITAKAFETPNCVDCCCGNDLMKTLLPHLIEQLELCQKSLSFYLETKRNQFPRFYFISDGVLLEILSQGSDPHAIVQHLQNVFDSLSAITFDRQKKNCAISMVANDSESVSFTAAVELKGNVEDYLADVVRAMQDTLQDICRDCSGECANLSCAEIVQRFPAQICILALQFAWTADNEDGMAKTKLDKTAMPNCNKKALAVLNELIAMTVTDLSKLDRTNVETLITIQVHQKDICEELVKKKVRETGDFEWQRQARFYWRDEKDTTVISICDVFFDYCYEYLGCKERLVITPLTDRCYITLSQAIGMFLGGAPAGPAGTGKTETTKDMGRTLGIFVVVFNCSDQMDYKALGKIFKGLAMAGCWGCFDEFNRIDLDVLSVAAQQVACVLTAQRERRTEFMFTDGQLISLRAGCSYFITMNPGYAGRQELPQNLKSLFRGVCMMVPDFGLIMRVKLASCGYFENVVISKKFDMLYKLCKQQLSKQTHYDYGLRNILSVLRTAGTVKRQNLKSPEALLLMRTLRDMNLSKLVAEDVPLFLSLIGDLFPGLQAEKAAFPEIESAMKKAANDNNLQYEKAPEWAGKCVQLLETYYVRHGIGVVGPTGAGKTTMMETLASGLSAIDVKHVLLRMNPKAITAPQMFGKMDPATGDWTDGIFSVLWRKGTKAKNQNTWIILDGPVDAIWIENLNTVLDDNKLLTLANGDRIPMSSSMKAFFEPENLMNASPATVSRMGIIYVSISVLGWEPMVPSWLATRRDKEAAILQPLIAKYLPPMLDCVSKNVNAVMYSTDGIYVMSCFKILEEILEPSVASKVIPSELQSERMFIFALCWSLGALLELEDRRKFDAVLRSFSTATPATEVETTFEYFVNESGLWQHWKDNLVEWKYPSDSDPKFAELLIPTLDSIRYESMLYLLVPKGKPVLFTGAAGVSKTATILQYLHALDREIYSIKMTPFSYVTTPEIFQRTLESCVEKRQGRTVGPPGGKKCALFIDDISMPVINNWGDQITNEIVRQTLGEKGIYSLDKPGEWKNFIDMLYTGAMVHPGGGRHDVPNRLKRQFCLFNVTMPSLTAVDSIFGSIIRGRLNSRVVSASIADIASKLTEATIKLWKKTSAKMLPTPAKFHYMFNMRELSRVFAGIFQAPKDSIVDDLYLIMLWRHECERVFTDKLTNAEDKAWESAAIMSTISESFGGDFIRRLHGPCHFVNFLGDPVLDSEGSVVNDRPKLYQQIVKVEDVRQRALEFQKMYNEETRGAKLEIVLFDYALEHLMRISRVINTDRGSIMLVGVGGSGKQSLTRLASFIAGNVLFQITVTKFYGISNLFEDIKALYRQAGIKGLAVTFLFTDAEVKEEAFLEFINQILSTGEVSNLFVKDEIESILGDSRTIAKKEIKGFIDTADNLMKFFYDRVRNNLHLVLCMSPVGDTLASRARKFPGLINCTTVDWFLPWPTEGLNNVAEKFITDFPMDAVTETKTALMSHMATVHSIVQATTLEYFEKYRRNVYVTPKSYLSFLKSYQVIYAEKHKAIKLLADKINNGLTKLLEAQEDVSRMKIELAGSEIVLAEAAKKSAELLKEITAGTAAAEKTKASVKIIADTANEKARVIGGEKEEVERDLEAAKPALIEAEAALNAIRPEDIKSLKVYKNPPVVIKIIFDGVLLLRRRPVLKCQMVEEKGTLCYKDNYPVSVSMMNEPSFLSDLQNFAKEAITDEDIELLSPYVEHSLFTTEAASKASGLAVGLCKWVKAMFTYHCIAKVVIPKMDALRLKEHELSVAQRKLANANSELQAAQDLLDEMQMKFDSAMAEKQRLQEETDLTKKRMDAANALIRGLAGEKVRWTAQSADFAAEISRLVGDCAMASAFMSYCGPFNKTFRDKLLQEYFVQSMETKGIDFTKSLSVIDMVTNDAIRGEWNLQGLPTDDLSIQNGILTTRASRYPIMVDPQGQGLTWTRAKEAPNGLKETSFTDKSFRTVLEDCLSFGKPLLIANVEEELDPVLDTILDKMFVKKGKQVVITLGEKECDVDPERFTLFITSRLPNPHFTPELSARVTVIDFTVTMRGLEDQLLSRVVLQEKPELQEERRKLLEEVNEYKKRIMELQDDLLFRLANCSGSLLDDPDIIDVLNITKKTSAEVQEKLKNAREAELRITTACEEYRPMANRGSLLYFLIAEMNAINVMYQTSLAQFIEVFHLSMLNSEKANIPSKRIANIIEFLTYSTFLYITRGLFETHKEVFSLLLALKVQLVANTITPDHFNCFLKGGAALDISAERKKPKAWIPDNIWLNCLELSKKLQNFRDLPDLIIRNESLWQQWYDQENPESFNVPDINERLDSLHKLLLIRSMRTDRTMIVAQEYIATTLGQRFVDSHPLSVESMHAESNERTPFVCILSMGSDPTDLIMGLAKKKKKDVQSVSMGQGQEVIARKYVNTGTALGSWVLLQNAHLGLKYLQEIEQTISKSKEIDPEFRIWITAEPHPSFPIGLLQMSIKFTNEAPVGMKAGMKRSYAWITQDMLDSVPRTEWKTLLWVLCYCHSVVQERRKYGAIGWTVPYEFNQSDLNACCLFLQNHLLDMDSRKAKEVTWSTIRYMISEIQYGGRITDDWDRRQMNTFAEKYFAQSSLEPHCTLHPGYEIPTGNDITVYRNHIESNLPDVDSPEVFGLNMNTDLQFRTSQAEDVFSIILETQPKGGGAGSGKSREDVVTDLCIDLLVKLPKDFIQNEVKSCLQRIGNTKPINICFRQEMDVLQTTLNVVRSTLQDLQLAVAGTIVMSEHLSDALDSMFQAKVPQSWLKNAWYSPSVGAWFQILVNRYDQWDKWLKTGRPKSYWISGFSNGQGFLTAMLQEVARSKQGWALDDVIMFTEVTKMEEFEVKETAVDGIFVHGLFLEGCSWSKKESHLIDSPPKALVAPLPVMYIAGVLRGQRKVEYTTYECPVYIRFEIRKRGMTAAQPNFMFAPELRTVEPPAKWILRGVALLTYPGD